MDEALEEQEDVMLQRIFAACENFTSESYPSSSYPFSSSSGDSSSTIRETTVTSLIERLRESWIHGDELLEELRKFLDEVSYDGQVCLPQFQEASRRWVVKMSRVNRQDGNNNVERSEAEGRCCRDIESKRHEESIVMNRCATAWYDDALSCRGGTNAADNRNTVDGSTEPENCRGPASESAADSNLSNRTGIEIPPSIGYELIEHEGTNSMELDLSDFKFRQRVRKYDEENSALREELARVEESAEALRNRISLLSRQLERAEQRFKQLEKENDDQREILEASERRGRACEIEIQRIEKERAAIAEALEKAETDKQSIPTLAAKLERVTREKLEYSRRLAKSQDELSEKELECETLLEKIAQLEKNDGELQESYETTVRHLRSEIRELQGHVAQLQMDRLEDCQCDGFSLTPPMGNVTAFVHATPCTVSRIEPESSLCAELHASGFFCDRRMNDSKLQELEDELNSYKNEVRQTLEIFDKLMTKLGCPLSKKDSRKVVEAETPDIQMLKQKALLLWEMATQQLLRSRRELKDASVEIRVESSTAQRLEEFNIRTFEDLLQHMPSQQEKAEVTKYQGHHRPASQLFSLKEKLLDETIPTKTSRTAKVFCASEGIQHTQTVDTIIGPIVAAIDEIIQESPGASSEVDPPRRERSTVLDSRHRCRRYAYTLPPSGKRSLTDTNLPRPADKSQAFPLEGPNDIGKLVSSRGDGPTRKDQVESLTENILAARDTVFAGLSLNLQNLQNRSITMESSQSYEDDGEKTKSSPSANPPAAKRKISVFHRSFDLDTFQNQVLAETMSWTGARETVKSSIEPLNMLAGNHRTQSHRPIIPNTETSSCPSTLDYDISSSPEEDSRVPVNFNKQEDGRFLTSSTKLRIFPLHERERTGKKERESKDFQRSTHSKIPPRMFLSSTENDDSEHQSTSKMTGDDRSSTPSLRKEREEEKENKKKKERKEKNEERNSDGRKTEDEKTSADPAVALAMSSGEDSSDSESDPIVVSEKALVHDETVSSRFIRTLEEAKLASSTPISNLTALAAFTKIVSPMSLTLEKSDSGKETSNLKRKRLSGLRRSLSESESVGYGVAKYCSHCISSDPLLWDVAPRSGVVSVDQQHSANRAEERPIVFPSLTDARLQESGIGNLPDGDEFGSRLSEEDLERKYTALSVGLGTDRVTLLKRMALSLRHRDQAERNLENEVQKMHQDIQALAPLCIDRESVERVERVRQQLGMIAQCAHVVSCAAETLGAVHQEQRISRAAYLADRYLRVLRTRCEKLAGELTETKRVLTENNIMVEESPSELGDDVPRLRYRSVPTNNRTMMTRRRASIATISRPPGTSSDQDGARQRNSVSGRMTTRRPSLSYDLQKWENDKLDRTDSSSSIGGELREIFEQAESRRNSLEENNNLVSAESCESVDPEVWTISRDDLLPEIPVAEDSAPACNLVSRRTSQLLRSIQARVQTCIQVPIRRRLASISIFWCFLIFVFFFGFCINLAMTSTSRCRRTPFKWWSVQEILGQYVGVRQGAPIPV